LVTSIGFTDVSKKVTLIVTSLAHSSTNRGRFPFYRLFECPSILPSSWNSSQRELCFLSERELCRVTPRICVQTRSLWNETAFCLWP